MPYSIVFHSASCMLDIPIMQYTGFSNKPIDEQLLMQIYWKTWSSLFQRLANLMYRWCSIGIGTTGTLTCLHALQSCERDTAIPAFSIHQNSDWSYSHQEKVQRWGRQQHHHCPPPGRQFRPLWLACSSATRTHVEWVAGLPWERPRTIQEPSAAKIGVMAN